MWCGSRPARADISSLPNQARLRPLLRKKVVAAERVGVPFGLNRGWGIRPAFDERWRSAASSLLLTLPRQAGPRLEAEGVLWSTMERRRFLPGKAIGVVTAEDIFQQAEGYAGRRPQRQSAQRPNSSIEWPSSAKLVLSAMAAKASPGRQVS